jgi:GWxTD domain-containing protein
LTCCAADPRPAPRIAAVARTVLAVALVAAGAADAAHAAKTARHRGRDAAIELINPRLGPEYTQWLVGAIARLATPEEIDGYLALADDAAAARFIEEFWAHRDPAPNRADNPVREAYDKRAAEADKRYSEAGYLGRRTDRGTIYVLFGPPSDVDYQISPDPADGPIEIWKYKSAVSAGLDGERPARAYRFIKRDDLTRLYVPTNRIGRTRIDEF